MVPDVCPRATLILLTQNPSDLGGHSSGSFVTSDVQPELQKETAPEGAALGMLC